MLWQLKMTCLAAVAVDRFIQMSSPDYIEFANVREKNLFLRLLRNPVYLTRIFFILIATLAGYWVGRGYVPPKGLEGSIVGFAVACIFMVIEIATKVISSKKLLLATGGLLIGLVFSWLIYPTIPPTVFGDVDTFAAQGKARILCNMIFGYFGIVIALKNAHRFSFSRMNFIMASPHDSAKILDTSVIVDGRIKELIDSSFMTGNFIVPEFVIDELQKIADSADSKRRARGRRGLDMLEQIKEILPDLAIMEKDYPQLKGVDQKLVQLSREINACLVTNDFNLQKVAQLHQVRVLNINELSNLLKPAVFIGEALSLQITREGKEPNQGIGYLEDGTMVVVEDGQGLIGFQTEVTVTSILQTPAGRMIFAKADGNAAPSGDVPVSGPGISGPSQQPRGPRPGRESSGKYKAARP
jgi:uncharacterized protein YacL